MNLKAEIEQHLTPLSGLKWSIARSVADLTVFHFGTIRTHNSGTGTVGDYALHIQGSWRIETDTMLYVGRSDHWNWKYGEEPSTWNYKIGGDVLTGQLQKLLKGYDPDTGDIINTTDLLIVERVEGSIYGDAIIHLTGGYRLVLFPTSPFYEAWHISQANSDESYFIVGDQRMNRGHDPITATDYLERAEQFHRTNYYERALADYDEAIRLEPENAQAYYMRAWLRDDKGPNNETSDDDYELAMADYAVTLRLNPLCTDAYVARAVIDTFIFHDYPAAIAEYSALIAIKPDDAFAYESRANLYASEDQHQYDAAMADYDTAIRLGATGERYTKRAWLKDELKDHVGALADLQAAIDLEPANYFFVHRIRGEVYEEMGDLKSAVEEYTSLIDKEADAPNPSTSGLYWNLRAWASYRLGDYEAALTDAIEAIHRDNTSWEYFHTRGAIYAALNQTSRAISDYQTALDFEPDEDDLEPDEEKIRQDMQDYIARWVKQA